VSSTKAGDRLYQGRTAVERVNAGCKVFWGADDGSITSAARFHAYVGVVMVVHAGLATAGSAQVIGASGFRNRPHDPVRINPAPVKHNGIPGRAR